MTTTIELMRKYGIPLPASTWTDQGLEAPEFQQVGESDRLVETPGYTGPETPKEEPEHELAWKRSRNGHEIGEIMPDDMANVIHHHAKNMSAPVEGAVCGVGGPPVVDIVVRESGYGQTFRVTKDGTEAGEVFKGAFTVLP